MRTTLTTIVAATAISAVGISDAMAAAEWSGFYGGIHLGMDSPRSKASGTDFFGGGEGFDGGEGTSFTNRDMPSQFMGGVQLGYNYQFDRFIIGIEGDASWFNGSTSRTRFDAPDDATDVLTTSANGLETIRGRAGFLLNDIYIYGTGGAAFSLAKIGLSNDDEGLSTMVRMSSGWTAGGGVETFVCPNVSLAVNFLYVDLGSKSSSASNEFSEITLHGSSAQYVWSLALNYHL